MPFRADDPLLAELRQQTPAERAERAETVKKMLANFRSIINLFDEQIAAQAANPSGLPALQMSRKLTQEQLESSAKELEMIAYLTQEAAGIAQPGQLLAADKPAASTSKYHVAIGQAQGVITGDGIQVGSMSFGDMIQNNPPQQRTSGTIIGDNNQVIKPDDEQR